jgi:hypothetical protein
MQLDHFHKLYENASNLNSLSLVKTKLLRLTKDDGISPDRIKQHAVQQQTDKLRLSPTVNKVFGLPAKFHQWPQGLQQAKTAFIK